MVVLGVDITKEELLKIATEANVEAKGTPASNVINVKFGDGSFLVRDVRGTCRDA